MKRAPISLMRRQAVCCAILISFSLLGRAQAPGSSRTHPTKATGNQNSSPFKFKHHLIDTNLPVFKGVGDYGQTALVDLNRDGKLDFVLGRKGSGTNALLVWYQYERAGQWPRQVVGYDSTSDVGAAALDVDQDGWPDLVYSGVWFQQQGNSSPVTFVRRVFDSVGSGAHDVLAVDINGDGRKDILAMGDERTKLNSLVWYEIPKSPDQTWTRHRIGDAIHGAFIPNGVGDLDGDGDQDVVRANTWYENQERGLKWAAHQNIPFGRPGPFGVCVRTAVHDMDGDGDLDLVMLEADLVDSKGAVLYNADGKGQRWTRKDLPQRFTYGSLHSLALADMDGDKRLDIVSSEQEELLPSGRENPRWVIWKNHGQGHFTEHIILDTKLGGHELVVGDVDGDGDMDICSKPWTPSSWNALGGKMHVDYLENLARP